MLGGEPSVPGSRGDQGSESMTKLPFAWRVRSSEHGAGWAADSELRIVAGAAYTCP